MNKHGKIHRITKLYNLNVIPQKQIHFYPKNITHHPKR